MATSKELVLCVVNGPPPSNPQLCLDILVEILQRLPQNLVHRCKCVSKRWLQVISSRDFEKGYIRYNTYSANLRPPFALFYQLRNIYPTEDDKFSLAFSENPLFKLSGFSLGFLPSAVNVLSSNDGLLLCSSTSLFQYYVCNPLTKQWVTLPPPPNLLSHMYKIGLLCRSANGGCGFRIVLVSNTRRYNGSFILQTYSSELSHWRESSSNICAYNRFCFHETFTSLGNESITINGLLHWVNNKGTILVFDPYEGIDKNKILSVPNKRFTGVIKPMIGVCNGRLRYLERGSKKYIVWELEDYDTNKWTLVQKFYLNQMDTEDPRSSHGDSFPLAFHPFDDDIVFLQLSGRIVWCNMRRKKLITVCNLDYSSTTMSIVPIALPWWPVPVNLHQPIL